jgi:hypothetical protein
MAERKMRYAVLSHFEKYTKVGNKAKFQWDADGLLESYSYDEIKDVIDYYAKVSGGNPVWKKLVYEFDDFRAAMKDAAQDRAMRKRNRDMLRKWMDE